MKKEWQTKKLGEICEIIMGQSPDGDSYNTTGEGVPLINGPVEFSNEPFGKTISSKFTTQPTKYCKEGDLILCVRGSTTGRMNIAGFDACVGRGVAAIRAKQYQPWINHFISSKRNEIHSKGLGATFPNVSGSTLADFEIIVPPLPEQQRIVGILNEAFEGIASAKANAEKNLQNARALFESHLHSIFTHRGPGWEEKRLGDVVTRLTNGYVGPTRNIYLESGVPYLLARHVKSNRLVFDGKTFISNEFNRKNKKSMLKTGDVLLVQSGHIGHSAVVTKEHEGNNCHAMIVISPVQDALTGPFLSLYFNSSEMRQRFGKNTIKFYCPSPHLWSSKGTHDCIARQSHAATPCGAFERDANRDPPPRIHLPPKARCTRGVKKVTAAPSIHWRTLRYALQIRSNQWCF